MYRTHIQCADVARTAWPKPAPLSARGLPGGLGRSATQTDSPAAGSAGQGAMRGHPVGVILGRGWQGWAGACLKSCLCAFVTPFVFLLLLLVAPTSALAATEANQEIGVPQAMKVYASGCFAAVLSPDVDRFYTLREGSQAQYQLTQYQINPFKKIGSIDIDRAQLNERKNESCRSVWVSNDKSKLIIVYFDRLFLLDARTGQVLNKAGIPEWAGQSAATALNDDDLVMLNRVIGDAAHYMNLTIWDANTLKLKKNIRDLGQSLGFFPDQVWVGMSRIQNRIYLENARYFVVLNSKTYTPELTVAKYIPKLAATEAGVSNSPKISKDFRKLYLPDLSVVTDHITGKQATYDDVRGDNVLVFDQETRHASIENIKNISSDKLDPALVHRDQLSRSKEYVLLHNRYFTSLRNLSTGMAFQFAQYDSGEAILLGRNKYFQLTPGARKYLLMKNSEGKIAPFNDATFNKYFRTEDKR